MAISLEGKADFIILGVGAGGFGPVAVMMVVDKLAGYAGSTLIAGPLYFAVGLALLIAAAFLSAIAWYWPKLSKADDFIFWAGLGSVASLNCFVFATGGPLVSVFSFHYLYVPVVVGITFKDITKGEFLKSAYFQAAIACWLTCVANALIVTWVQPSNWTPGFGFPDIREAIPKISGNTLYMFCYLGIFTIQIVVASLLYYQTLSERQSSTAS